MIYNFYVDKEVNNKNSDYIDVKLQYPINIIDDEYLKIKVIDLQYLNNMYNVSSVLQNNIFNLEITPLTYDVEPALLDILTDVYDVSQSVVTYRPTTVLTYDTDNDIQFITSSKYKIHYKDFQIIDGVDSFDNVFYGITPTELKFNEFDNYIIIELLNNSNTDYLRQFTYAIKKTTANNLTQDETFRLVVQGSHDNITYTTIPIMTTDSELITFTPSNIQGAIIDKVRVDLINRIDYKYYKFSLNASFEQLDPLINGFKLNTLKLYMWTQTPYTLGQATTYPITIPDGFYKASSYISTINNLIASYNTAFSLDSVTNKVNILHSLVDNIKYPYTDPLGKIIIDFPTPNIRDNIGINTQSNILVTNTTFVGDTNINLINFKKLILTTNLEFQNKTHNEFLEGNNEATGIGNILLWIDNDYAPYTYIKYNNYEDVSYRIENKQINNIVFNLYNEKSQKINLDNMLIHFQIEKFRLK